MVLNQKSGRLSMILPMFSEGMEVEYDGDYGMVDFIHTQYITIKLPGKEGRSSPRLVIFPQFFDRVKILKDSEK